MTILRNNKEKRTNAQEVSLEGSQRTKEAIRMVNRRVVRQGERTSTQMKGADQGTRREISEYGNSHEERRSDLTRRRLQVSIKSMISVKQWGQRPKCRGLRKKWRRRTSEQRAEITQLEESVSK